MYVKVTSFFHGSFGFVLKKCLFSFIWRLARILYLRVNYKMLQNYKIGHAWNRSGVQFFELKKYIFFLRVFKWIMLVNKEKMFLFNKDKLI